MTKHRNPYDRLSADELEELIECYFDCSLSEDDEMSLRKVLSATVLDTPAIREAKAVMGYEAVVKSGAGDKDLSKGRHTKWLRAVGAAAVAAMLLSIGAYFRTGATAPVAQDDCVAYVNGQRINNKEAVMQMMKVDLLTMQAGSESVADGIANDFSALREAIGDLN